MSSFSGLSALLTVSIVALVTMQMLKDNFNVVEGYDNTPYTVQDMTNYGKPNSMVNNKKENIHNTNLHDTAPFVPGTVFSGPKIYDGANKFNATPDTYRLYQAEVALATPTADQLRNISSQSLNLPGPFGYTDDNYVSVPHTSSGRASNLSLCSQNFSMGTSPLNVSASLLPDPAKGLQMEGFEDCPQQTLANQVFLTKQNGLNMSSGSLRNGNLDLRSAPPNPTQSVGPWMNSTIYPDLLRRPLEGCGPSFGLYGSGNNSVGVPAPINP
jgi:hypothetical protein